MAAVVWDLQRYTLCCSCGSLASTPGCSRFEFSDTAGQGLGSAFPAGGLPKLTLRKRRGGQQRRSGSVTRSLYSPLVQSFEDAKHNLPSDSNSQSYLNDSGAWRTSSPTDTPMQHHGQGQAGVEVNEVGGNDSDQSASQDPLTASFGDEAHAEKRADIGHDIDMKKGARIRARARPPSMSISQGFSSVGRHAVSHTAGAVGHPLMHSKVSGPIGFVMACAVAVLGVKTAVEKQGLLPGTPQKICEDCDGYGVQQCHVCRGRGVLTWEGKLLHTDPCPLCFGRCVKKCSSCGGVKIKKGLPPSMSQPQVKAGSNRK